MKTIVIVPLFLLALALSSCASHTPTIVCGDNITTEHEILRTTVSGDNVTTEHCTPSERDALDAAQQYCASIEKNAQHIRTICPSSCVSTFECVAKK